MELKRLKVNEIIKYIVGALVAVFAFILGRRTNISSSTGERVNSLGDSLEQISDTVECSERTDRELRESMSNLEDSVSDIGQSMSNIRGTVEATEHTIDGVRETHSEIERASEDVGKSISRIRDLIKEERERNQSA